MPSSGSRSIQRNVDPTHHSSFYVAFAEVFKILNTKILKYIKLITIKPPCCNINSIKSVKNNPFQVLQLSFGLCLGYIFINTMLRMTNISFSTACKSTDITFSNVVTLIYEYTIFSTVLGYKKLPSALFRLHATHCWRRSCRISAKLHFVRTSAIW